MKKVVLYAISLCLLISVIVGCDREESTSEIATEMFTEAEEVMPDEYIIERFYEAQDFWGDWIYGQKYVTDRMNAKQNVYYGAVNEESPIQTKEELKEAFEACFTKELAEEFMGFLNPEEIDGKLYIAYGDVGDNGEVLDNVTVKKLDDSKYELTLDMTQYFTDEKFTRKVYCVLEDGKWVFENDEDNKFFFRWE